MPVHGTRRDGASWRMIRNPEDPYNDEEDGDREVAIGTPWTIVGLGVGLAIALALWCAGIV